MRSFLHLYLASWREFRRDLTALFWTIALPLFFMLFLGAMFSPNNMHMDFKVGIVNEDGDSGTPLVEVFKQNEYFKVTVGDRASELKALDKNERALVIVIPAGTGATLQEHQSPAHAFLEVYYYPDDKQTVEVALPIVSQQVERINEGAGIIPILTAQFRPSSGIFVDQVSYMLPGILALSLMQLGLFTTTGPLVSLRQRGVLHRMSATPLPRSTLLASQIAFRLTVACVQTALFFLVGIGVFGVHVEMHNLPGIIAMVILGATMFITLGYFLACLAKTEEAVQGLVLLPSFIFMFMSGILYPIELVPKPLRPFVEAIPLTYLGDALRQLMLDARSYYSMMRNVAILAAWLIVCLLLAIRFFHWEPQG